MARTKKLRTCTVMTYTNGSWSIFAVLVGPMKGKFFNAHKATVLGEHGGYPKRNVAELIAYEKELTARYATLDAPPVSWQV